MAKLNSKQLKKAHADIKDDARRRVAERGVLQFRADPETVLAILDAAEKQRVPVGTLLRQWIQERLTIDTSKVKAPDLVQRVASLEEAVTDLQQQMKHRR